MRVQWLATGSLFLAVLPSYGIECIKQFNAILLMRGEPLLTKQEQKAKVVNRGPKKDAHGKKDAPDLLYQQKISINGHQIEFTGVHLDPESNRASGLYTQPYQDLSVTLGPDCKFEKFFSNYYTISDGTALLEQKTIFPADCAEAEQHGIATGKEDEVGQAGNERLLYEKRVIPYCKKILKDLN